MSFVYKICPADTWREAESTGIFNGAGIDLVDGFIHFSTADQVAETAFLHFNQVAGLVLVAIPEADLDLTWEPSRGGVLFPHLYGALETDCAAQVFPLEIGDDGQHIMPPSIPRYVPKSS